MWMKYHACILFVMIVVIHAMEYECPPNEDIFPCTCSDIYMTCQSCWVICEGLQNIEDLSNVVAGLKGYKIHSLSIEESHIGNVPGDLFNETSIKEIYLSKATLSSIGDKDKFPFSGLENSLERLSISEGFVDEEKPLSEPIRLGHLKKLRSLHLINNVIPELGDDWFADGPVSLKFLTLYNCRVKKIGHSAFTNLKNLYSLSFIGNSVSLARSAIAENPSTLYTIDLSDNGIQELPNDMFTNMPALESISLSKNQLTQLSINAWKPLMRQIRYVNVLANPLICDHRIKEFVKENFHEKIFGHCASPANLNGRRIEDLTLEEIED